MDVVDRLNHWWFSPSWEDEDKHLRQWQGESEVGARVDSWALTLLP
ncbi:hypothetical protein [Pyrobaculum sp.]